MNIRRQYFAVDRVENGVVVVEDEAGALTEVSLRALPTEPKPGYVLVVVSRNDGTPDWASATRDHAEERRRIARAQARLRRLTKRDPGGDVEV